MFDVMVVSEKNTFEARTLELSEGVISILVDYPEYITYEEPVEIIIKNGVRDITFMAKVFYITEHEDIYNCVFTIEDMDEENEKAYNELVCEYALTNNASKIGIWGKIKSIIKGGRDTIMNNKRKLARITLYKSLNTTEGKEVMLYNFNYEYMLIGFEKNEKIDKDIEVVFREGLTVKGTREYEKLSFPDADRVVILYQVTNTYDILSEKELKNMLVQWADEYKQYA